MHGKLSTGGWPALRSWIALILAGVAFFATARLGMALFSLEPRNIALIWLPSGIGFLMCRQWGVASLPVIFLASFAANVPGMEHPVPATHMAHAGVAAGANVLEAWLACWLMARYLPGGIRSLPALNRFILWVVLPATLFNALILVANLGIGGYRPWSAAPLLTGLLVFSNSLGMLLLVPLFEVWRRPASTSDPPLAALLGVAAIIPGLIFMAFAGLYGAILLVIPVLLFLVFMTSERYVYPILIATVCIIVALAARDMGPFQVGGPEQSRFMLLAYLFTLCTLVSGVSFQQRDLVREMRSSRAWRFRASHDPLTGLANRLMFLPLVEREMARCQRLQRPFCLALIDIDHFKVVNDTYGHGIGDSALVELANRLVDELRGMDFVARMGGEEFAVLLPETDQEEAQAVTERMCAVIDRSPLVLDEQQLSITISCGLVQFDPAWDGSPEDLIDRADRNLYRAKRQGRNQVVSATPES